MSRSSRNVPHWLLAAAVALVALTAFAAPAQALTGVDLSTYKRVGRYDLPEPTRTSAPANNLLAQEASGVTYNWDTGTLFVVGDGGTSVTQVSKTGALVNTMTLPPGGSSQGTEFYDTEGIAYIGNGEFVMTEERDRQAVRFTYVPGGTLTRGAAKTVKLGTTIGNIGLEGLTNDPVTGGYVFVKEMEPLGVFQTGIDWAAGTATNGGPAVVNSTNLFNPALAGLVDFSDVFALANLKTMSGPQTDNLLIISQESGKVVNVSRSGSVASSLTLVNDPGNPLSIQQQTHEGLTMDDNGVLYTVSESGGGDADHPQLWVFEPTGAPNQAPTAVALSNQTNSLPENSNTATRLKLADLVLTDDGIGTNTFSVTGPDASSFEAESGGLYLKAGTVLNKAAKETYEITVKVEDTTVAGSTPVTVPYTLTVTSAAVSDATTLAVTEVAPWGSGDGAYGADWFELTNTGTKTVNLAGWRMDDESASFGAAVTLNGVATLAPGESAIFTEDDPATVTSDFINHWFGGSPPAGFKIGSYTDTGTGLSTGGDQVNIFSPAGTRVTGVAFGASTPRRSFDNSAALGSATSPLPVLTTLSSAGTNGAVTVGGETGSPGVAPVRTPVTVSEVAPWGSGNAEYGADWFELTNVSPRTLDLTGWKIDDDSNSFAAGSALTGVSTLAPGESAVFVEGDAAKIAAFKASWFGSSVPAGLRFGNYAGPGLGTGGDQVNIFNDLGQRLTGVAFGASTTNVSFDNAAGAGSYSSAPTISTLSVDGVNGAFKIHDQIGSPGKIAGPPPLPSVKVTEVSSTSSSNATYSADFWELTNTGSTPVDLSGWKVDDDSNSFASALALSGVSSLAAGESAIFIEGNATTVSAFKSAWFGSSVPAGLQIGTYSGSGIGLSSSGDQVNVFNSAGTKVTGVRFGAATAGVSFDNAAGIGSATENPPPTISTLSVKGTNGAFSSVTGGETGSPGRIKNPPAVAPANTAAPTASGTAGIGASLSCAPGTWAGTPAPTFGYQWLRNGAPIGSATSSSYTTVAADGGAAISCEVTATNSAGSAKATSNAIQMPAPGLYCAGVAISGGGSRLQVAAQGAWGSAFTASICPSGPAVSYVAGSEAAALASWSADGVSGTVDTSRSFLGVDRAPDAGQIANIKAAAGAGAQLAVIPVAQTAVAVIANTPAGCTVEEITSSNLVAVFEGRLRAWSDLATAEGSCGAPISRVVPKGSEAVSGQFKNYLFQLNKKALACAPGNATWEQLRATDTVWPESCSAKALSPLLRPGTDGVPAAVSLVGSTAGAIGFAPLPDAIAGGAESLAVQNNGFAPAAEATFALPSAGAAANCSEMTYKRPTGGGGLDLDWSEVFGAKPAIGAGAYPLCMLTYAVAFHGYEAAGFSVGQERTAKDYLNGLVVTTAGQVAMQANGYAPVPASASAQFDILGEARKAAAKITR